ncbi:MAG: type II toxin-antitoxin system ParD family antitoxin [Hyphomicrobiaceae bacterium]|nr:type II toxin-antitoxin system ParD family antitoxin [Hyphomicrobiaceae bacterium]
MTERTTLNVSLTAELGDFIQSEVDSGRYRTASEVVRAALRLLQQDIPRSVAGDFSRKLRS